MGSKSPQGCTVRFAILVNSILLRGTDAAHITLEISAHAARNAQRTVRAAAWRERGRRAGGRVWGVGAGPRWGVSQTPGVRCSYPRRPRGLKCLNIIASALAIRVRETYCKATRELFTLAVHFQPFRVEQAHDTPHWSSRLTPVQAQPGHAAAGLAAAQWRCCPSHSPSQMGCPLTASEAQDCSVCWSVRTRGKSAREAVGQGGGDL